MQSESRYLVWGVCSRRDKTLGWAEVGVVMLKLRLGYKRIYCIYECGVQKRRKFQVQYGFCYGMVLRGRQLGDLVRIKVLGREGLLDYLIQTRECLERLVSMVKI